MIDCFLVCRSDELLSELMARWHVPLSYAVAMDESGPTGIICRDTIMDLCAEMRATPDRYASCAVQPTIICELGSPLGTLGAQLLHAEAAAALVQHDRRIVGIVLLLDVLQALLWGQDSAPRRARQAQVS